MFPAKILRNNSHCVVCFTKVDNVVQIFSEDGSGDEDILTLTARPRPAASLSRHQTALLKAKSSSRSRFVYLQCVGC